MKKLLFLSGLSLVTASCQAQTAPRIAVFDPQNTTLALRMDTSEMNAVAATLDRAGLGVARGAPFPYTPITQNRMTEVALARLLANGASKWSLFYGGGDFGGNNYIDGNGQPYPGYVVLQDYFPLAKNGGSRLDIAMTRADGAAQRGIYLAGARHSDGSVTVVINPAEVVAPRFDAPADAPAPVFEIPLVLRVPLSKIGAWKASFGGQSVPVKVRTSGGMAWGEIRVDLKKRGVLTVTPSDR